MQPVWIGLRRYTEQNSPWKWINLKTGEGTAGDNLSQSISWFLLQSRYCAVIDKDLMWHNVKCSNLYGFYCSDKNKVGYVTDKLTWSAASIFCQKSDGVLVTVTRENTHALNEIGWIGLYQESDKTWRWAENITSNYRNWAPGEPLNDDCGSLYYNPLLLSGRWHSNVCSEKLSFLCYDDNLVVVKENKTWEAALEYCQKMEEPCNNSTESCKKSYDLLSLTDMSDYNYVRDRIYRATTDEVWVGLRFLGGKWWWLNGEKAGQKEMLPDCPSNTVRHCGTMSKYGTNNWIIRDCSQKRNFICYTKLE
ncbi:macrophage mannose receptor 1-like [Parambassis ranga]|uniref:Macrophage mannose receptor 1-like n=1 Tax=Parambassis ranga TaxID=210632 RepID=A0A6P7K2J8_9TELE|nr:macrophage mannose receptor 1-like [Parambassis ranga]